MTVAKYELLTRETIPEYIHSRTELRHIFSKNEPLTVTEISHGNLNTVFDVRAVDDPTRNVIVKQAPPYLYSIGESWMLDPVRAHGEARALQLYNQIVPNFTPDLYSYDPERYVIVMQNLDIYVTWREALINGQMDTHVAHNMGVFLAHTLGYTAHLMQNEIEKNRLLATFNNAELHQMTLDYVFTLPFQRHESNHYSLEIEGLVLAIQQDEWLTDEVQQMRAKFATCQQSLIHGDLHTGSIMVSPSETKIIDPEFICVGPMSFDIGALIGNLWLNYAAHEVRTSDSQERVVFRHYLETMIRDMWQVFISELEVGNDSYRLCENGFNQFARQLLRDVAGIAGCIILRRVIGSSGVEDIRGIKDLNERAIAATLALNIGRTLLLQRHEIETIDQLIDIATISMKLPLSS